MHMDGRSSIGRSSNPGKFWGPILARGAAYTKAHLHYVLRILETWSSSQPDFEEKYWSMSFGSQILIESLHADLKKARVHWLPIYRIEREWCSMKKLAQTWRMPICDLPAVLDVSEVVLIEQPHSSISLVKIPGRCGSDTLVFKSSMHNFKYLYHGLRLLLCIKPYPNIIPPPKYIVTKQIRFGGKRGVCGFILDYYLLGILKYVLEPNHPL